MKDNEPDPRAQRCITKLSNILPLCKGNVITYFSWHFVKSLKIHEYSLWDVNADASQHRSSISNELIKVDTNYDVAGCGYVIKIRKQVRKLSINFIIFHIQIYSGGTLGSTKWTEMKRVRVELRRKKVMRQNNVVIRGKKHAWPLGVNNVFIMKRKNEICYNGTSYNSYVNTIPPLINQFLIK